MVKKDILRRLIPTALGVLLLGQEFALLPAYAQGLPAHTAVIASSTPPQHTPLTHHHIDVGSTNPWHNSATDSNSGAARAVPHCHSGFSSQNNVLHNPSSSVQNSVAPHQNWSHVNQASFINQTNFAGNMPNGAPNYHHLFHHHPYTVPSLNFTGQQNNTAAQSGIGGYHAGYVIHHHNPQDAQAALTQQANFQHSGAWSQHSDLGHSSLSLNNHFLHNGSIPSHNQLSSNSSANANSFHHFHSFNNQSAITLSGSKTANGSLLGSANLPSFLNLDLSSSQAIIRADNSTPIMITLGGHLGLNGTIVGGMHQLVTPGQMLTAAQYAAMEQVVTSGQQTLILSGHGTAISGLITLVAGQVNSLSGLVVPTHVAVDTVGFTSNNALSVAGITQINGSLYTLEQTANITSALTASSLIVGGHGLISSSLPGLSLFNTLFAANGLNIGVTGNLTNQGTISSTGTLNISANQIANVSTPNHTAVMTGQNLNLYSASGNINNSGQLIASNGSVDFNTAATHDINVNNTNGTVQALLGDINLRESAYSGNANINLTGGDWLAKSLNLNSGNGIANANINNVTGPVNTSAAEAHITTAGDLIIGNTNLSGDPSFFVTSGSAYFFGTYQFNGQDLAIVTSHNIVVGSGSMSTSSTSGNAGNITMIAGANVLASNGSTSGASDTTTHLTVTGASATGGYIIMDGSAPLPSGIVGPTAITALDSSTSHAGSNGGNITLVAYKGSDSSSGAVKIPATATLSTGGAGSGSNGNVTIIAGATSGTAITTGTVNTTGGTGGGGNITLATQAPVISGAPTMNITNGSITNGASYIGGTTNAASIIAGNLSSPGASINVTAGQSLTTGSVTSNGVGANGNGGNITLQAGAQSTANLQVTGSVTANGAGTGSGGTVNITYNDSSNSLAIGTSTSHSYISGNVNALGTASGSGGHITFTNLANAPLDIVLHGSINAGSAGNIIFTSASGQQIQVNGSGSLVGIVNNNASAADVSYVTGTGNITTGNISNASGNITVTANDPNGSVNTTQSITSAGTLNLSSGNNGSVSIAGATNNSAASITITTPSLIVGNSASFNALVGNVNILSNGPGNTLAVNLGQGSSIVGTNVNFNTPTAPGSITMNSGFGTIGTNGGTGQIILNGGTGAVNINAIALNGYVVGGGLNNLAGSSVNITVNTTYLTIGDLSSPGTITLANIDSNYYTGIVLLQGNLTSTGSSINVTSGTAGLIQTHGNVLAQTGINITTPDFYNGLITSTATGDINIQSNDSNHILIIYPYINAQLNAATGNVNFNPFSAGSISMPQTFGAPQSTISANGGKGLITFNGGAGAISINAMTLNGILTGAGPSSLAGSSVNVLVTKSNLTIGNLSSPGIVNFTNLDNSFSGGNINVTAALSSSGSSVNLVGGSGAGRVTVSTNASIIANTGISITTPILVNSGNISTQTGDLNIQSNKTGHILTVQMGLGSKLTASTGNVNFNPFTAGTISITAINGGSLFLGDISANGGNGQVNLNIGTGSATVWANSIAGLVRDPNANFHSPASGAVLVIVAAGQLTVGNFATSAGNGIQAINTNNNGALTTAGDLISGANITLIGGNSASLTIGSGNKITATDSVYLYAPVQNINGFVTAKTGDMTLQSYGTNNNLTVNFGPALGGTSTQLTANSGNVNFNTTISGAVTITGGPGNGLISASNDVVLNGGTGAINTNNQQIIGCIHVNGSSINMQTSVGDLDFCLGINTSSATGSGGNITIAANGGAINSGAITTNGSGTGNFAGNITLSASNGMNLGNINANGSNGASGGNVSISLPGQTITGTYISAVGNGVGNGGSIATTSGKLVLSGTDSQGNSIDANGGNTGGNITIITTAPQAFIVGNGDSSGNGTRGNISSNGINGGFIILGNNSAPGGANQIINGQVTANGTTGSGGKVELQAEPFGQATLTTVFNGGLVQATNNANRSGRVGFNGGPGQNINILGIGIVNGGEFVHVGNLDRFTLEYLDGRGGNINISPQVKITNNFSTNGNLISAASTPAIAGFPPPYYPATDFTPWGHFYYEKFQPEEKRPRFALGLAYKRRTTAYIPGTKSYSHIFTGTENNRLASDGMKLFGTNSESYLNIDRGNILLSPDKSIVVGTHEGKIAMAPGSIAFVMESGSDVVVYNLRQSAPNQVSVSVNNHKIILHPGTMLVLTRQSVNDFENIDADCHMISYRGAQEIPLGDKDVKAFVAQYSIASAITAVEPLQQLIASNNTNDTTVLDKIVRSAVMLGDFTGTIDTAQLANLDRDANDRLMDTDEKVLDNAKQMAASKNPPIQ